MASINTVLGEASDLLIAMSDTARLDAEILLAKVLNVSRTHLFAYPDQGLTKSALKAFLTLIKRRIKGEPIAYITGTRSFHALDFFVTKDTFIPRPETEMLVDCVLKYAISDFNIIADLGTGSGAIALSIKQAKPHWQVHATDHSLKALKVAKKNARALNLTDVSFHAGDWCDALPAIFFDAIVANPPYIAEEDLVITQKHLRYEPKDALIAKEQGLSELKRIILTSRYYLKRGSLLILEHGFNQASDVRNLLGDAGFKAIVTSSDFAHKERVTHAHFS